MNRKLWQIVLISLFALLLMGMAVAMAQGTALQDEVSLQARNDSAIAARAVYTPTTVLTVTSTSDPDTSLSYTCYRDLTGPPAPAPDGICTLRRAIVEAGAMDDTDRPILIKFNIPLTDTGYISTTEVPGAWKIELIGNLPYVKGGQVIIDGDTQGEIGGRTDGPKIIIKLHPNDGVKLGEIGSDNDNMALGLALQEGYISLYGSHNVVEDNWVGLTDNGQGIYYIDDDPQKFNYATISGGSDDNVIRNNRVASSKGKSIYITGDDNIIVGNYVGTRADGTIPDVSASRKCHPNAFSNNWFTGVGISIGGHRNRVGGPTDAERNIIAGMLFASADPENSPPDALDVYGEDHVIQNNYIGKDVHGQEVWVCGRGISLDGKRNLFLDNVIVNAGLEAIGIYGSSVSLDAITLRGNTIKNAPTAIEFGSNVPSAWVNFKPAKITEIDGTTVSGIHGDGSPCAECVIELFLDDRDDQVEALQSLAVVTATADGSWTAELTHTLAPTQGLRTASTTSDYGQIVNFDEGTTSDFSVLYTSGFKIYLPLVVRNY